MYIIIIIIKRPAICQSSITRVGIAWRRGRHSRGGAQAEREGGFHTLLVDAEGLIVLPGKADLVRFHGEILTCKRFRTVSIFAFISKDISKPIIDRKLNLCTLPFHNMCRKLNQSLLVYSE